MTRAVEARSAGGWRLVHFLGLLGCLVTLPALLFSGYLIARFATLERQAGEARLEETARRLNLTMEREVSNLLITLRVLASSTSLAADDREAFHRRAQVALHGTGAYVILVDEHARQLLNTRVPYGTPLDTSSDPEPITQAIREDRAVISGVFFGRVAREYVFNVIVPVDDTGHGARALILTRNVGALSDHLAQGLPDDGTAMTIADRNGRVVVAMGVSDAVLGEQIAPDRLAALDETAGLNYRTSPDGEDEVVAHVRSALTGWVSYIILPAAAFEQPFDRSWRMLLTAGTLLVLLTLALALALGRRLALPIEALARDAEALGRGEAVALRHTPLREANKVGAALHRAGQQRDEHEQHVQLLMRELTHRAKNLVSVVQAIARMTARNATDIDGFLAAFLPRLLAFGRSIDLLAGRNWSRLPLRDLIAAQIAAFSEDLAARFTLEGPEVLLKATAAERLGLALHELSTNAAKYGALGNDTGTIAITWSISPGARPRFTMTWQEHGGPGIAPTGRQGFGHQLTVVMPAQSLRGTVDAGVAGDGFRWHLDCPAHMVSADHANPQQDMGASR